jgi:hypothetical protein
VIHVGDTVKTGNGSQTNKCFRFIFSIPTSLQGRKNMTSLDANKKFVVQGIKIYKTFGDEFYYIRIYSGDLTQWYCEVEDAIKNNELLPPNLK